MNMFDAIIIGITLILGIKGFFNGIVKEIAGIIGIIGGLFAASKYYNEAGIYINEHIFKIENQSAIYLVGFIAVFVGFWLIVIIIAFFINKMLKISALSFIDRIFGFVFSSAKFFILIAIIIALIYKVEFLKEKISPYMKDSLVFPFMLKIGEKIINFSPQEIKNNIKNVKIPVKQ